MTTAALVRNDIPSKGSEMWETQWKDIIDDVVSWLDQLQDDNFLGCAWSLWEVRDFTEVPFPHATMVEYRTNFGDPVFVNIIENATWLDLWKAADECIAKSGDRHHPFVEKFIQRGTILELHTGS